MDDTTTKTCRKCERDLPMTDYYGHGGTKDGRHNSCKRCMSTAAQQLRFTKDGWVIITTDLSEDDIAWCRSECERLRALGDRAEIVAGMTPDTIVIARLPGGAA